MQIRVNGEPVSPAMLDQELHMLIDRYRQVMSPEEMEEKREEIERDARENALERVLLFQKARKEIGPIPPATLEKRLKALIRDAGDEATFFAHLNLTPDDRDQVLADLETQMQYEQYLDGLTKAEPTPSKADCLAFYEENKEHYTVPETVRASHILQQPSPQRDPMLVYSDLLNVRKLLVGGADFAEVAHQYSEAGDGCGDMGFLTRGQLSPPFEEVVFGLAPGEISDVFNTEYGYHLVKVVDKMPEHVRPFEEVYEAIQEELLYDRKNRRIGDQVDLLRAEAEIEEIETPEKEQPEA